MFCNNKSEGRNMKIVIVKQKDLKDCGCCCLASIIKYYHGFVPLEKIRKDTLTDNGGTRAFYLIETAKKYGFDSIGKRIGAKDLSKQLLPLIAHIVYPNGYSHYVVIYKIKDDKLTLMDPAQGKVTMKIKDFKKIWSNVIIIFHPKTKIVNFPKNISVFSIFFNYLKLFKNKYTLYILINIVLMILTLIYSLFLSFSLDNLNSLSIFYKSIIIFIIVIIIKNIMLFFKTKISSNLNYLIDTQILKDFTTRLFNLPLYFWKNRTPGEIISRSYELNHLKNLMTDIFISLLLDSILAITSLIILAIINIKITIFSSMLIALYLIVNLFSIKPIYKKMREIIEKDSLYNELLIENINLYETILNLSIKDKIEEKMHNNIDDLALSSYNFEKNFNLWEVIKEFLSDIINFMITFLCIYLIFKNTFDIPVAIMYISLSSMFFNSLKSILSIIPKYNFFKVSFEKISEFYSIKDEKEIINNTFKSGDIEFENITISYDNYHKIIKNFNAYIKNKSHILLTGKSGSGKSTLLKCLINDEYEGNIKIAKINLKDYSSEVLRKNIVYVGQNDKLFSDTIYNNISCYKKIPIKKLYEISKICMIDKIIDNKPLRYMSLIDNDLSNISGGERQKIILARSLLLDASIYILDEALSEVDYKSEIKIINNIRNHFSNKTIIYVSHKNVNNCFEKIIKLKQEEEYE